MYLNFWQHLVIVLYNIGSKLGFKQIVRHFSKVMIYEEDQCLRYYLNKLSWEKNAYISAFVLK